jgi:hypothetical protein
MRLASAAIVGAVAVGDLTPSQVGELSRRKYAATLEVADFERLAITPRANH